jgi:hypothetical protein
LWTLDVFFAILVCNTKKNLATLAETDSSNRLQRYIYTGQLPNDAVDLDGLTKLGNKLSIRGISALSAETEPGAHPTKSYKYSFTNFCNYKLQIFVICILDTFGQNSLVGLVFHSYFWPNF